MRLSGRIAALLSIGGVIAVPIAGCGGSGHNSTTGSDPTQASTSGGAAASGPGGTVGLTATDYKFNPSDTSVKAGKVAFNEKNAGRVTHSLEIENVTPGHDQELEGTVAPGRSGTLTVNLAPGKYTFYCPIGNHRQLGMEGSITVN